MLININDLYGDRLAALDGDIGHVKDFYFDDKSWMIRYVVANTGSWLTGRLVLLAPHALAKWNQYGSTLHVKPLRKQIQGSPPIEAHALISRQFEIDCHHYYGWPAYWEAERMQGFGGAPAAMPPPESARSNRTYRPRGDVNLRSTHAVIGYNVESADGMIGHVSGFLADDRSWAIRELVVESGHWSSGKNILIPTGKVERISYEESKVFVNVAKADRLQAEESDLDGVAPSAMENMVFPAIDFHTEGHPNRPYRSLGEV